MKKTTLVKTMLLLCALVVGSSNLWATDETATFDFDTNAGTNFGINGKSSSSSTAGDITSNVQATINDVTVTITPSGGSTANRFWESSPKLRLYGGTMTISAGTNILKSIAFNTGSGKFDVTVSTGSVSGSKTSWSWAPTQNTSPSSVVFTISSNTQIKSFTVTYEVVGDDPSIAANNVNIGCNATNGSIAYTINNAPTPAGALTAAIKGEPSIASFVLGAVTASAVPFTCAANSTASARTATVTLTYTYGNSQTVTKDVTITQAAYSVTAPEFSLATGSYIQGTTFTITSAGNTIYYTTDGSTPSTSSNLYTGPIAMTAAKVTYKAIAVDGNNNESSPATRTYTGIAPVALPFGWAKGTTRATINSMTGVSQTGLDSDYADANYKLKFNSDNDNIIIFTDEKPVKVSIGVKMLGGGSTSKFSIQESTNGAEFTEVEQLTISGEQDDVVNLETTQSFAATTRVIKLNFVKGSGSNVGVGPVSITAETATISLNAACTDGEKIYGTYSSSHAFRVPTGLIVSAVSVSEGKLVVTDYSTGDVVKANTGVMVSATSAGDKTITLSAETGTEKAGNMLKPSGDAGISAANMTVADTKFYRLTMHNGTKIGFWWGAAGGAAFDLAAHKAYLAIPDASEARAGLWFGEGDVTAIEAVKAQNIVKGEYFNLAGQRVAQPTKGLYIVNGKKVVIK